MRFARLLILADLLFSGSFATAQQPPQDLVKAKLLADTTAVQPGRAFQVGVLLDIQPSWHLYWINPGDGGIPTTVNLKLPDGFTASEWQYPTPQRFEQAGGLISYGYERQAMLIATVMPPANISGSNVTINAEANWLVCEKVCVPGDVKLSLNLPASNSATPDNQSLFSKWSSRMPTPIDKSDQVASHHVQADVSRNGSQSSGRVTIKIEWARQAPSSVQWFPPASNALSFSKIHVETKDKTTTITAAIEQLAGQEIEKVLPDSVIGFTNDSGAGGLSVPVKL